MQNNALTKKYFHKMKIKKAMTYRINFPYGKSYASTHFRAPQVT
jgi:hypothetical protein